MYHNDNCWVYVSDRPGVRFQPGPGSNILPGALSGRGRGFLVKIWSPVRLAEVMKLFENLRKNCNLAGGGNFSNYYS